MAASCTARVAAYGLLLLLVAGWNVQRRIVVEEIAQLARATAHHPQAGHDLRLARAYERRLAVPTRATRATVLANARDAQARALRIDSTGRYLAELEALGRRLDAASGQPPAGG